MIQDRCFENSGEEPTPSLPPREKIGSIERISAHLARFEGDGKKNAVVNPATRCVSRYFTSGVEGRGEFHSSGKSWREKLASSPPAPRSRFSHNLSLTMMPSDRQLFARGRKISAPSVDIPLHPSLLRREQPPCHESPSSSLFRINNYHHPRIQRKFRRRRRFSFEVRAMRIPPSVEEFERSWRALFSKERNRHFSRVGSKFKGGRVSMISGRNGSRQDISRSPISDLTSLNLNFSIFVYEYCYPWDYTG